MKINTDEMPQAVGSRPLSVHWVVDGPLIKGDELTSPVASTRYRVLLPAKALREHGHRAAVTPLQYVVDNASLPGPDPDLLVLGKPFNYRSDIADAVMKMVDAARSRGVRVLCDIVDDHFARTDVGDYWVRLMARVDLCVAGSEAMADTIRRYTGAPVVVIGDAIAAPKGSIRVYEDRRAGGLISRFRREPLKLVWYGFQGNIRAMERWAFSLGPLINEVPTQIRVVTNQHAVIDELCDAFNKRFGARGRMEFIPWSEEVQWATVAESDVVLIPVDLADPRKTVKTANRLTDALHSGRYVIASALPAYQPYADFAALSEDPVDALHWYLDHPSEARARVAAGQEIVARDWSAASIVARWSAVFEQVRHSAQGQEGRQAPAAAPEVRLNLGCGDKILPSYVNVDIVASRAGRKPDVLCDLHRLTPFADGYADEVMAIHVVEHFWRWEVEDVLREWIRVLKPGGRLILECPNLEAACAEFLRDPDAKASEGAAGQTTMWVFYGDPAWRDPLMVHRWGYTPTSLSRLLESVGLVDVQQQPAQFKLREPRDMRIVGVKPA